MFLEAGEEAAICLTHSPSTSVSKFNLSCLYPERNFLKEEKTSDFHALAGGPVLYAG